MRRARDSSTEMKDVIKAEEEGVKEDGELTCSRLQEGFVVCLESGEGVSGPAAPNQELMV